MKNRVLFAGCSYVRGNGFDLERNEPGLWVNLLHQQTDLKQYQLVNTGLGGRSNAGIFQDAVNEISKGDVAVALVCWTSMPRYEMELGTETYVTRCVFVPNVQMRDYNLNDINYTGSYLTGICNRFTTLATMHYEIANLVSYVNSLVRLANLVGTKLFFVNSMCPWDNDYFKVLENVLPNQYTPFTQKILHVENRDDDEVFAIYNKVHSEYNQYGGIQESYWLNLYNSLSSLKTDVNSDGMHPGIESNQFYFELLNKELNTKLHSV